MTPHPDAAAAPPGRAAQLDSRRNIVAYTGDTIGFFAGIAFIPATTVLVGLASALTRDKTIIGLVAMAWSVASMFPQLIAARLVQGRRRTKPYVVITSLIGRQAMLLFAIWLLISGAQPPALTLILLIAAILVFNLFDAVTGIAWFDMLSRNLSPRGRGRILGLAQLLGSLAGIGSGLVVARVLSPDGPPFPGNYAVVFACAWVGFFISLCFQLVYAENPAPGHPPAGPGSRPFLRQVAEAVRGDAVLRKVLLARALTGLEAMTAAFYVVYIKDRLALPDTSIGVFSLAFIAGGILGVALFGWLAGRWGARSVMRAGAALQAAAPLLALAAAILPGLENNSTLAYALFVVILALDGAAARAYILGFCGYTIDQAPEHRRAIHVGMLNTLSGLVALSPVLAGAFLDAMARHAAGYPALFAAVGLLAGGGVWIAFRLPSIAAAEA